MPTLTTVPEKSHPRMLPGVPMRPTSIIAQGSLLLSTQNAVRARYTHVSSPWVEICCGGVNEDAVISKVGDGMVKGNSVRGAQLVG